MSKYYKAEDMENLIINIAPDGEVFELGMSALQSLPTIEVSVEQLSKLKSRENSVENTTVSEDFTSISRAFHEQKEGEYSVDEYDLKDFTRFLAQEFPDLVGIRCYIGTGDSNIWFFREDLEKAEFY